METLYMGRSGRPQAFFSALRRQHSPTGWRRYGLVLLSLLSQLYHGGVRLWAWSYTSGLWRCQRLPCRVVSIGNLTLGGTGKTPLTMWVARWYQQQGWRVAVLSRGYGGNAGGSLRVVSTGEGPLHTWQEVGDEPYLLACALPGIPVLIGKNRYHSGLYACKHFGTQIVVLDDGFQHYALQRDLDIVLIDATSPLCQEFLLPRGNLREPLAALQRADILVLSRTELAGDTLQPLGEQIPCWHAQQSLCSMSTVVESLHHRENGLSRDVLWLQHRRVVAVAGIGRPEAFAATLRRLGSEVTSLLVFPDHHAYTEHDWRLMVAIVRRQGAACLITTTKDAVRFAPSWKAPVPVYILHTDVAFTQGEDVLYHQLRAIMPHADGYE